MTLVIATGGFFLYRLYMNRPVEKAPESIDSIKVSINKFQIEYPGDEQAKAGLKNSAATEKEKIANFLENYLNQAFLRKQKGNPEKSIDLNNLIVPGTGTENMKGNPTALSFPPLNKEILATTKGKCNLKNMIIAYNADGTPAFAHSSISFKAKYLLQNEKKQQEQLNISLSGQIMLEPVGDEWRITDLKLRRKDGLYKLTDKENG